MLHILPVCLPPKYILRDFLPLFCDGQANACALVFSISVQAGKDIENTISIFLFKACPVIAYFYQVILVNWFQRLNRNGVLLPWRPATNMHLRRHTRFVVLMAFPIRF